MRFSILRRCLGKWFYQRGLSLISNGQYGKALVNLERSLELLGDDGFAQMHLAWAYWYLGHHETAKSYATRATELIPQNPAVWVSAGKLSALQGRWDDSETAFQMAIDLAPDNFVARSWLAFVLLQKSKEEEAFRLLRSFPITDDPYLQARLVLYLERKAIQIGERSKSFDPPPILTVFNFPVLRILIGYALRWRGERLIEDGNWDGACRYLQSAVNMRPNDLWAKLLWSIALLEGGYLSEAESILANVPATIEERNFVSAALLVRKKNFQQAIELLSLQDQRHPLVRYYFAVALSWLEETGRACSEFLEPLYHEDPSFLRQRIRELLRQLNFK